MKAVRVAIAVGIAILLPMLAAMTVRIWAEPPETETFYNYYEAEPKGAAERAKAEKARREQNARFEKAQASFNLQMFYTAFPLGILEILLGYWLRRRTTLAAGLLFGGLSTVACGSYSSWESLPGWARYVSLLFVLCLLGALAIALDRSSLQAGRKPDGPLTST